jgi:hypothetical protein
MSIESNPYLKSTQKVRENAFESYLKKHRMIGTGRHIAKKAGKASPYILTMSGIKMDAGKAAATDITCSLNLTFFYRQKNSDRAFFYGRTVMEEKLKLASARGRDASGHVCEDTRHLYFSSDYLSRSDVADCVSVVIECIGALAPRQKAVSMGYVRVDLQEILRMTEDAGKAGRRGSVKTGSQNWFNLRKGSPRDLVALAEGVPEDSGSKIALELRVHEPFAALMDLVPHDCLVSQAQDSVVGLSYTDGGQRVPAVSFDSANARPLPPRKPKPVCIHRVGLIGTAAMTR